VPVPFSDPEAGSLSNSLINLLGAKLARMAPTLLSNVYIVNSLRSMSYGLPSPHGATAPRCHDLGHTPSALKKSGLLIPQGTLRKWPMNGLDGESIATEIRLPICVGQFRFKRQAAIEAFVG
jgi:hypothetical protein